MASESGHHGGLSGLRWRENPIDTLAITLQILQIFFNGICMVALYQIVSYLRTKAPGMKTLMDDFNMIWFRANFVILIFRIIVTSFFFIVDEESEDVSRIIESTARGIGLQLYTSTLGVVIVRYGLVYKPNWFKDVQGMFEDEDKVAKIYDALTWTLGLILAILDYFVPMGDADQENTDEDEAAPKLTLGTIILIGFMIFSIAVGVTCKIRMSIDHGPADQSLLSTWTQHHHGNQSCPLQQR